jgi:hypothetical protein
MPIAQPNANITELVATTNPATTKKVYDSVTKNNALLSRLMEKKNVRMVNGGAPIRENILFSENGNATFYSGAESWSLAQQNVITAAEFGVSEAVSPIVIVGNEKAANRGSAQIISLLANKMTAATATLKNIVATSLHSDGTGYGGREFTGLQSAISVTPTAGTYGSIDRSVATNTFWRNQAFGGVTNGTGAVSSANIQAYMNTLWFSCTRGSDCPDLIIADNNYYNAYLQSLQSLQRFPLQSEKMANLGFQSLKYQLADVVLDGGIGGAIPTNRMYFLNTDYLFFRPLEGYDFKVETDARVPVNQDAEAYAIFFKGNLTCGGAQFQGVLTNN